MADDTEYEIGSSLAGMVTLKSLGIKAPQCDYIPFSMSVDLGDGNVQGLGSPRTQWHWGFLSAAQRTALKTYCTGSSAAIWIRSRADDNAFYEYTAILVWPPNEERVGGRVLDFTLEFRLMTVIP